MPVSCNACAYADGGVERKQQQITVKNAKGNDAMMREYCAGHECREFILVV